VKAKQTLLAYFQFTNTNYKASYCVIFTYQSEYIFS